MFYREHAPTSLIGSIVIIFTLSLGLGACNSQATKSQTNALNQSSNQSSKNPAGHAAVEDLQVVDCLLPGQVRRLGQGTYLTPGRPVLTTAADCRIRGGQYTEFDRADYKTALKIWMPAAESGDAEAQANVGEIFERGLGSEPNYEAAIIWYKKAAAQGNSRAQFNLGTLYEQGLGVQEDKLLALNLYRQAWGMEEDNLMFQSAAQAQQEALRKKLTDDIAQKDSQINLLNRQLNDLEGKIQNETQLAEATARKQAEDEVNQLKAWIERLENERLVAYNEVDQLPRYRQPDAPPTLRVKTAGSAKSLNIRDMNFGKYYALVIGNQNYDVIDDLATPYSDAQRAKDILEGQYGFNVTVLLDADAAATMRAINELNDQLGENDNLLIYYAGHGSRIRSGEYEAGYWLPVNANPPPDDTFWVSNEFVTRHLARLKAKRVMVVADSCFAGLLSNAPGFLLMGNETNYSEDYVRYKLAKKSRLLLSSGGDQPVLDNADSRGHSVFASAFLDALENAGEITSGPELYLKVHSTVIEKAKKYGVEQEPEFKVIKGAGHEVGDFFFVRQTQS